MGEKAIHRLEGLVGASIRIKHEKILNKSPERCDLWAIATDPSTKIEGKYAYQWEDQNKDGSYSS